MNFPRNERGPYRGQYVDPEGQLLGTFEQLMVAGCIQAENRELMTMFHLLMAATGRNPCAGCPIWTHKGPECGAFREYHSAYAQSVKKREQVIKVATTPSNVPLDHPLAGLSVKKIAERLQISIGEVRRRKAAGTL